MPIRPSKRPLPKNVFHTVEFGAGFAYKLKQVAQKNPQNRFIAVDPAYGPNGLKVRPTKARYDYKPPSESVEVSTLTMNDFLKHMKANGLRTKNIIFRMPDPNQVHLGDLSFKRLLVEAQSILEPNGKIRVTTENEDIVKQIVRMAKELGYSVRAPKELQMQMKGNFKGYSPKKIRVPESEFEKIKLREGHSVFEVELTYGLKKAIPNKSDRRTLDRK